MRFNGKANGTGTLWQFVSKATRLSSRVAFCYLPVCPRLVSKEWLRRSTTELRGPPLRLLPLRNLLNLMFYKLLNGLRCLKATVVAFIQDHR
jgi:hypothetical protein